MKRKKKAEQSKKWEPSLEQIDQIKGLQDDGARPQDIRFIMGNLPGRPVGQEAFEPTTEQLQGMLEMAFDMAAVGVSVKDIHLSFGIKKDTFYRLLEEKLYFKEDFDALIARAKVMGKYRLLKAMTYNAVERYNLGAGCFLIKNATKHDGENAFEDSFTRNQTLKFEITEEAKQARKLMAEGDKNEIARITEGEAGDGDGDG